MSANEHRAVVQAFFDAANAKDIAGISDLLAEDARIHTPIPVTASGRAGFLELLDILISAVPDHQVEVHDLVAEGDRVAARHTHRGTHRGELMGIPPTGVSVEVPGIEMFRVENGRIAEFWHMDDLLALLQQIGAVPAGAA